MFAKKSNIRRPSVSCQEPWVLIGETLYCRKLSPMRAVYEMYQITKTDAGYTISHGQVDAEAMSETDMNDLVRRNGYRDLDAFVMELSPTNEWVYDKDGCHLDRENSPAYIIDYQALAAMAFQQDAEGKFMTNQVFASEDEARTAVEDRIHSVRVARLIGSIMDGPGLRFSIVLEGRPHACQEPAQKTENETEIGAQKILGYMLDNSLFTGATFCGGEPFDQAENVAYIARKLKGEGYETACYTGYRLEQLLKGTPAQRDLLNSLDVLVDGPHDPKTRDVSLRYRSNADQRVLNARESLKQGKAVWVDQRRWLGQ